VQKLLQYKSVSIAYSVSVFVALGMRHALRYIVICGLPSCTILFPHYLMLCFLLRTAALGLLCDLS